MSNHHILVPLDLVRGPANALVAVQEMAVGAPISITLLHVIDLNIFPPQPSIHKQLCAESQAALRKLAKLFFGAEKAVRIVVRVGKPAEEIIAEAKASEADLIVICGPKTRWLRLLHRNTTQQVLRSAPCPTLVIPHPSPPSKQEPLRNPRPLEEACFAGHTMERVVIS